MMARCYDFAVIRLAPSDSRDERLNIGALIFKPDGVDVRISARLEKIRAISAAVDVDHIRQAAKMIEHIDCSVRGGCNGDVATRHNMLSHMGPIALSALGKITVSDDDAYEGRVQKILRDLVEPEPAPLQVREKRSRLFTQVKKAFKEYRVLARKGETLEDHRIVPKYEVGEGLVADLVLKNGKYHVVETVDLSRDDESIRKAVTEIGASALTLESAQMAFGSANTNKKLVYAASAYAEKHAKAAFDAAEHQGCELINWASYDDQSKFIGGLAQLATPTPGRGKRSRKVAGHPRLI